MTWFKGTGERTRVTLKTSGNMFVYLSTCPKAERTLKLMWLNSNVKLSLLGNR